MKINPYLLFNGHCAAAFKFYEQVLDGKIESSTTHAGTPAESRVPPEWRDKILHASLRVGDQVIMGSDAPPGHFQKPQGFSVTLVTKDAAESERVFHALAQNGTVTMPIAQTFWSLRFGMLIDQFGIPWMVNCEQTA